MKYDITKRIVIYIFSILALFFFGSCGRQSEKVTYVDTAMGTIIRQTLYVDVTPELVPGTAGGDADKSEDEGISERLPEEIMALLNSLEKDTLSWREETSEIYQINLSNGKDGYPLSQDMQQYLNVIRDVWEESKGAFDVTIGEVTRLWNIDIWAQVGNMPVGEAAGEDGSEEAGEDGSEKANEDGNIGDGTFQLPDEGTLQAALLNTGFEKIRMEDGCIYMSENVKLDLGAVGKGIACDEVLELLESLENVSGAVISVGGSVLTYGEKPDGSSWKVAIQHPREAGVNIAALQLRGNWCVSTSGDYERYVEKDGVRYHHIMDPKTGYPADSGIISVTIVSKSGLLSDALSTACFVLGKDAALELAAEYNAEAYIIDKDLNVYMTEGMDKLLVLQ